METAWGQSCQNDLKILKSTNTNFRFVWMRTFSDFRGALDCNVCTPDSGVQSSDHQSLMQSWTLKVCEFSSPGLKAFEVVCLSRNSREISANSANLSDVPPAKMLKGWTHKSDFEFKKAWEDEFLKMQAKFNFAYNFQYFSAGIFYELACSPQWTFQNSDAQILEVKQKGWVKSRNKRVSNGQHQWEAKRPKKKRSCISWKIQIF